jgi:hypothetical protein
MAQKTLILVPGRDHVAYKIARLIPGAFVGVTLEQAKKLAKTGRVNLIVVFLGAKMGRKYVPVPVIHNQLRTLGVTVKYIDGFPWDIPDMFVTGKRSSIDLLRQVCAGE